MYSIYKYKLRDNQSIAADVLEWLSVGLDPAGEPCVWARVKIDSDHNKFYRFNEIGTGWSFDDTESIGVYLGTLNEGPYVWHYFAQEIIPQKKMDKDSYDRLKEMLYTTLMTNKETCFA